MGTGIVSTTSVGVLSVHRSHVLGTGLGGIYLMMMMVVMMIMMMMMVVMMMMMMMMMIPNIRSRKFNPQPLSSCLASIILTISFTLITPVNGCFLPT